jgi:hypothetical protein
MRIWVKIHADCSLLYIPMSGLLKSDVQGAMYDQEIRMHGIVRKESQSMLQSLIDGMPEWKPSQTI